MVLGFEYPLRYIPTGPGRGRADAVETPTISHGFAFHYQLELRPFHNYYCPEESCIIKSFRDSFVISFFSIFEENYYLLPIPTTRQTFLKFVVIRVYNFDLLV